MLSYIYNCGTYFFYVENCSNTASNEQSTVTKGWGARYSISSGMGRLEVVQV